MEAIMDSAFLSKLAKIGEVGITEGLFTRIYASASTAREIEKQHGNGHIEENVIISGHVRRTELGKRERSEIARLKKRHYELSKSELETLALAKNRKLVLFTNEAHLKKACTEHDVRYMSMPMLLKTLWAKKLIGKNDVLELIRKIENEVPAKISGKEAIFES